MCSAANSANNSFWWPSRVWWKSDLCTPTPWRFWAGVMWTFEFFVLCLCIVSIVLHCIAHDLSVSISLLTIYYSQSLQISHCIPNMAIATHPTRWPTLEPAFTWCTPWQQRNIVHIVHGMCIIQGVPQSRKIQHSTLIKIYLLSYYNLRRNYGIDKCSACKLKLKCDLKLMT